MKVIVAGYPKTGTKSMNAALTELGFVVYDGLENLVLLEDEYTKILEKGWSTEDFRRMYENVDAVTDMPACFFWDEIHKAFPDAKIILTLRDTEDVWWNSLMNQFHSSLQFPNRAFKLLSPTSGRVKKRILDRSSKMMAGFEFPHPLSLKLKTNEKLAKKCYRSHNAYVMQTAPKDKLLVYKCSEEWEPLCKFLGVPVPENPFPRRNVRGSLYKELKNNPVFQRLRRECIISLVKIAVAGGVVTYCSIKYGPINSIRAIYDHAIGMAQKIWFW